MGYLYFIGAALMFSFVGTLVKIAQPMVTSTVISFSRFFFGFLFLFILTKLMHKKVRLHYAGIWIWVAIVGKCMNYFAENYAISQGFSYGNVIVWPFQAIVFCLFSQLFLKERITRKKLAAIALCILGVLCITWNGTSMDVFFGSAFPLTMLFVVAAIGGALFTIAQKMMTDMDPMEMNMSVFLVGMVITAVPMIGSDTVVGDFRISSLLALMGLGIITGGAFLLTAKALKTIPLYMAGVVQSLTILFTLSWGVLFFGDPMTIYIIIGAAIFILGLVWINLGNQKEQQRG